MSPRYHKTLLTLIALTACAAATSYAARPADTDRSNREKADYIFLESARASASDDQASTFELVRRAAQLDPESTDLGYLYGVQLMTIAREDTTLFNQGYSLADRYFNSGGTDYYNLFTFGQINEHIGNLDKSIAIWERLDSLYPKRHTPTLKLAERLVQTGDSANIERALGLYDRLETLRGKNTAITYRKMAAYMQRADTAAVIDEARSLMDSAPLNSEYALMTADLYAAFNRTDSALTYYNRAISLDPNSGSAIYRRANFYLTQGDSTAYRREVMESMRHESLDFETKMELMTGFVRDSYTDESQRPQIAMLFDEMISQYPREVPLRELYSSYLHAINDFAGSAEQLEYAVDVDPADETRWRNIVGLYINLNEYDKASDAASRALHYFPGSADFITTVGTGMIIGGRLDEAETYLLNTLEQTDTTDVELTGFILTELGDIANHKGDKDKAIDYYAQAKRYIPRNALLLNNYAYILAEMDRDLGLAEEMSAESLLTRPDEPTYLDTYAWILFRKKDFAGARTMIDRAMANMQEPAADVLEHAGDIYFFLGETADAIKFWEQAFELAPDNQDLKTKVKTRSYPIK